jgi:hypothetical protein
MRTLSNRNARAGFGLVLVLGLSTTPTVAPAKEVPSIGRHDPTKADTSRAARESATQSIPLDKLTADGRAKVSWVLANTSVFRRLPLRIVQCDPDLYLFLVHHPDVVVNVWEVLGVSCLTLQQTGPNTYKVADEIGTTGIVQFLYRSQETNVVYVDGTYKGTMFNQQIRGRGVMILKSGCVREGDGRYYVTSRLDAFMNIEPGGVEFLTQTFQPIVGKIADNNFAQTAGFLGSLSRTAEVNATGMQRLAKKLVKVQPEVRQRFGQLSEQVAGRAGGAQPAGGPSEEDLTAAQSKAAPRVAQRPTESPGPSTTPQKTPSPPTP